MKKKILPIYPVFAETCQYGKQKYIKCSLRVIKDIEYHGQ